MTQSLLVVTDVKIYLIRNLDPDRSLLKAYASVEFSHEFVVHDIRILSCRDGNLIIAMPSRKHTSHCPECERKVETRAHYCQHCGVELDLPLPPEKKEHLDLAHPTTNAFRRELTEIVLKAYYAALYSAVLCSGMVV